MRSYPEHTYLGPPNGCGDISAGFDASVVQAHIEGVRPETSYMAQTVGNVGGTEFTTPAVEVRTGGIGISTRTRIRTRCNARVCNVTHLTASPRVPPYVYRNLGRGALVLALKTRCTTCRQSQGQLFRRTYFLRPNAAHDLTAAWRNFRFTAGVTLSSRCRPGSPHANERRIAPRCGSSAPARVSSCDRPGAPSTTR